MINTKKSLRQSPAKRTQDMAVSGRGSTHKRTRRDLALSGYQAADWATSPQNPNHCLRPLDSAEAAQRPADNRQDGIPWGSLENPYLRDSHCPIKAPNTTEKDPTAEEKDAELAPVATNYSTRDKLGYVKRTSPSGKKMLAKLRGHFKAIYRLANEVSDFRSKDNDQLNGLCLDMIPEARAAESILSSGFRDSVSWADYRRSCNAPSGIRVYGVPQSGRLPLLNAPWVAAEAIDWYLRYGGSRAGMAGPTHPIKRARKAMVGNGLARAVNRSLRNTTLLKQQAKQKADKKTKQEREQKEQVRKKEETARQPKNRTEALMKKLSFYVLTQTGPLIVNGFGRSQGDLVRRNARGGYHAGIMGQYFLNEAFKWGKERNSKTDWDDERARDLAAAGWWSIRVAISFNNGAKNLRKHMLTSLAWKKILALSDEKWARMIKGIPTDARLAPVRHYLIKQASLLTRIPSITKENLRDHYRELARKGAVESELDAQPKFLSQTTPHLIVGPAL